VLSAEALGLQRIVCVAPKGLLPARVLRSGQVTLAQLTGLPLIALDATDPLGMLLAHSIRDHDADMHVVMTVQTYHVALALAHHAVGVALIDACTAASADPARVPLAPFIDVPIQALRPTARPHSQTLRQFTRCMQRALHEVGVIAE